nr:cation/H+ exchanger [Tanacetum cinerariifolium]
MKECCVNLENCEKALSRLQDKKEELQREVVLLNELAEKAQTDSIKADEDVANVMLLAEEAVAFELEAMKRVSDAEIALQKAEKILAKSLVDSSENRTSQSVISSSDGDPLGDEKTSESNLLEIIDEGDTDVETEGNLIEPIKDIEINLLDESRFSDDSDKENEQTTIDTESDNEKMKNGVQTKKIETQKDIAKDSSQLNPPKSSLKKSSRFFSASFFSLEEDGTEFTPAAVFQELSEFAKQNFTKLLVGSLLVGA